MSLNNRLDFSVEKLSFEIVSAEPAAVQLIMQWRNDPETRRQSFHGEAKTWPAFLTEFNNDYCADPTLPCLFALLDGKRIGFLRFRRVADPCGTTARTCDISINVSSEYRGRGLGTQMVKEVLPLLSARGLDVVLAECKLDNPGSIKMFESAGFKMLDEVEHRVVDTGETVSVKRLTCSLTQDVPIEGKRKIGAGQPCFIIAEAGSNWRMGTAARDMRMARTLIDVAVEAGADAVKFQTYRPETTYVSNAGESDYLSDAGIKESISDIFADLAMPYEMLPELAEYCRKQGILFMSSPFSVADLQNVDPFVALHKIASYEISHLRLIEAAAATGKPLALSTGASDLNDIAWAVNFFKSKSNAQICLMQCTAKYPADLSALNLSVIPTLKAAFGVPVGLSDHSRDPIVGPLAAVALGANLIEKHYTLDNHLPGPDHAFAVEPDELKAMVLAIRAAEQVGGTGAKQVLPQEEELYWYARRGLQATRAINAGEALLEGENFDTLRPGKQRRGIHPQHLPQVCGGRATRNIALGDGIRIDDFSKA